MHKKQLEQLSEDVENYFIMQDKKIKFLSILQIAIHVIAIIGCVVSLFYNGYKNVPLSQLDILNGALIVVNHICIYMTIKNRYSR